MSEKELHTHGTDCACGHNHHHHDDGCGCGHDHAHEDIDKKAFLRKLVPGLFFFLLGAAVEHLIPGSESSTLWHYVELAAFALSYIFVGFSILREAVEGVLAKNIFNENLLMAVASLGAFAIGEYSEGCAVVLLYTVGEFLQSLAVQKSRRSIKGMLEQKPDTVRVQGKDGLTEAAPETVQPGQTIVVEPGEKIHLDGTVLEGNAEVDTAALTGESIPVSVAPGMEVLAGSVAIDGALTIRVDKPYGDSVARVLAALEHAQDSKSHTEKFITRFARIYTPIVCGIALALVLIPPLFFGGDWHEWIYRGLSALVVSCPCAIVISVPLSFFGGLGTCSREGILVKGADHLETLARCDVGVFDKTGTITSGKFEFVRCECVHCHCIDKHNHRELLRIIAACERLSTHPIAKSICLAFGQFADDCVVTDAKNYAGMGVSAVVDGVRYYAGNEKLMQKIGVPFTETQLVGTAVYCCTDTEFLGDIVFADIIKTDSREAIDRLHRMGMKQAIMLTGDRESIAADIAAKAGLDGYYAKLLPEEKVQRVQALQQQGHTVLYAGDGINDAPVLAAADLGVAMGGAGADVAIEASDMVIQGDSLSQLPVGVTVARKTVGIARENIIFAIAVKLLIILGCAVGIFDENAMWLAVFGDVGVCLLAVANALRVLHIRKKKK